MIIVNTTFVINKDLVPEVLQWLRCTYEKSAVHAGADASRSLLARVLTGTDEEMTYAMHLVFDNLDAAERWTSGVGASLLKIAAGRWGEKVLAFKTYLETV